MPQQLLQGLRAAAAGEGAAHRLVGEGRVLQRREGLREEHAVDGPEGLRAPAGPAAAAPVCVHFERRGRPAPASDAPTDRGRSRVLEPPRGARGVAYRGKEQGHGARVEGQLLTLTDIGEISERHARVHATVRVTTRKQADDRVKVPGAERVDEEICFRARAEGGQSVGRVAALVLIRGAPHEVEERMHAVLGQLLGDSGERVLVAVGPSRATVGR
mmetsp:Transcript_3731/g.10824  ORF Transcript_3731/g.10824 Transcript_3731/m.10824 type:complete len:216 (+) Transcript_3731:250-897(+)